MRRRIALALAFTIAGCGGGPNHGSSGPNVPLVLGRTMIASGLAQPMQYLVDPGDVHRAYVLERAGKVRLLVDDALAPAAVLDLTGTVFTESECGLQGMTFAPDFATSRLFYLQYSTQEGGIVRTRVSRFTMPSDGTMANPVAEPVIRIDQPYENHKGGTIRFGGDGLLYLALGDGGPGAGNDPDNRAQSGDSLLGKVLRIDPSGDDFRPTPTRIIMSPRPTRSSRRWGHAAKSGTLESETRSGGAWTM